MEACATLQNSSLETINFCAIGPNKPDYPWIENPGTTKKPFENSTGDYYNQTTVITSGTWQLEVAYNLFLYLSPILIIVGTCGNVLSLVVLQTVHFKGNGFRVLLSALAIVDTGVLTTGLLRHWLRVLTLNDLDIRNVSTAGCKIHVFLSYVFPQISSWTLMMMAMCRAACVLWPLKVKHLTQTSRVLVAWILVALLILGLNMHLVINFDLRTYADGPFCYVSDSLNNFFLNVWSMIDFVIVAVVPLFVITVCNAIIIHKTINPGVTRHGSIGSRISSARLRSTTAMLVSLSLVFLLTTVPWGIYFIGLSHWPEETLQDVAKLELAYTICNLIYNFNSASNFFLYCISGSKFRFALKSVLQCQNTLKQRDGVDIHAAAVERSNVSGQNSLPSVIQGQSSSMSGVLNANSIWTTADAVSIGGTPNDSNAAQLHVCMCGQVSSQNIDCTYL